ncbi:hypothetical protein SDC9_49048 [bioreactor metagenome]|uniref:Uncharacterized protein n=1 Tax=bioreactor metagenome TaxID=1076179 RepID=A0A644WK49_9ZZZZ
MFLEAAEGTVILLVSEFAEWAIGFQSSSYSSMTTGLHALVFSDAIRRAPFLIGFL